ncbi:MAG TPA: hypothetical protein VFW07_18265 [Parafilimonas sp.]|nr:hypothetical protein [Parafilimonas sp.]
MKHSNNEQDAKSASQRETKQQVTEKLETVFASLLPVLGEKKFNKRIKKARKVLLHTINGTTINKSHKSARPKISEKKFRAG